MREVKRGEIYWVDWNPGRGSEETGLRPALIIQNDIGNHYSRAVIIATCSTADVKPYPFIVPVKKEESGLPEDFHVNLSAILTIDKSRLGNRCGELNKEKMIEVDAAIKSSLGLK